MVASNAVENGQSGTSIVVQGVMKVCKEMSVILKIEVQPVDKPEAAVKGADVALCATSTEEAIFFK